MSSTPNHTPHIIPINNQSLVASPPGAWMTLICITVSVLLPPLGPHTH
jgi:hypothetical protein